MNKDEFLRQLEVLLSGISQEERTEALAFTAVTSRTPERRMRQRY